MAEEDHSRRELLGKAGGAVAAASLGTVGLAEMAEGKRRSRRGRKFPHPKTPDQALSLLLKGNKRYQRSKLELRDFSPKGTDQASQQLPFAAIVTCADSRLAPELVFDIDRGNIFVSKIAGNSLDTGTLGSTEYAVGVLGVKLIFVLGHSDCGAVKAAIGVANGTSSYPPDKYGAIGAFVDKIVPSVLKLPPDQRTVDNCVPTNARYQADLFAGRSPIIDKAVASGQIKVVAGAYNIKNGKVNLVF